MIKLGQRRQRFSIGFIKFENIQIVEKQNPEATDPNERSYLVVMNRHGELLIVDEAGRERERYGLTYGAKLYVREGQKIEPKQLLSEWDAFSLPILTEASGIVKYGDVIDGVIAGAASERGPFSGTGGGAGATLDSAGSEELPLSWPLSRFMPILTVPSTITTTLAPTSRARIFEDSPESPDVAAFAALRAASLRAVTRFCFGPVDAGGAAAAACAARRAA